MTSKIVVNNIGSDSGINTVTFDSNVVRGSSNFHSVGVELAGINVLGADTPIGTGATIYDDGGARFSGIVSATSFVGSGANLTGIDATAIQTGTTKVQTSATLITNQISGVGIATVQAGGINVTGIVTANSFKGDGSQLTGISGGLPTSGGTLTGTLNSQHILPSTDDTYNLGSTTKRWANIYTNDLKLSNEGKSNDVDGTWGSYTIQEGESDLFLINNRNGKKYKFNLTEVL